MSQFKPSLLTLALLTSGMTMTSLHAQEVQEAETDVEQVEEQAETEVIQVTGMRRSLIESVNIKRFSDTMVDAVTADDLGSLPDLSISDALSRLAGVTAIRNGGQASELNIRGLSGQYVFATLNGREQVSTAGGRSVEFSQFPSELITTAKVHKSQKASLIEGGVAGTVDLETANPLSLTDDTKMNFNLQLTGNSRSGDHPDAESVGHRLSFSYQTKFLDDTLGLAVGAARLFQPRVSTQFVGYGYSYDQVRYDGLQGLSNCGSPTSDPDWRENGCFAYSGGFEMMSRGGEDERNGFMTALVWQPTDDFSIKADAFYSTFESQAWDRGLQVQGLGGINSTNHLRTIEMENPTVVGNDEIGYSIIGGTYYSSLNTPFASYDDPANPCKATSDGKIQAPCVDNLSNSGVNPLHITNMADDATTKSDTLTLGLNATWVIDNLTISADWSHSKASEDSFDRTVSLIMFEDSAVATPKVETDLVLDYHMNGLKVPTVNITNKAGETVDFTDTNKMMVSSYSQFPRYEENQADALRLDLKYELENDYIRSLEAGVRVSERKHLLERGVWSYGGPGHFENGQHLNKRSWDDMRQGNYIVFEGGQEVMRFQPYQLSADEVKVVNLGGEFSSLPSFIAIDNEAIADKWLVDSQGNPLDRSAVDVWAADWTITNDREIKEEVKSAYVMANIDTTVFDLPLTGNIGIRYVDTAQTAIGVSSAPTSRRIKTDENGEPIIASDGQVAMETIDTGDAITDDVGRTESTHLHREITHEFDNWLPSLNLNLSLTDNDNLKFAIAKVIARPDMAQMAVSGNFNYEYNRGRDGKDVVHMDMSTSPYLEPFQATQWDIAYEHYFTETDGTFFVAYFNKEIQSFTDTVTIFDFPFADAGIDLPTFSDSGRPVEPGDLTVTVNNDTGGYIRGYEIGYTQTFDFLPEPFNGLGFSGSYSHTESEITTVVNIGNGQGDLETPIEGLSPSIYSFTLFYNYDNKFETHLNAKYRESYLGRQVAVGSDQSAFFAEETIIDYQAKYNINDNMSVIFSINNLTDEANRSYFGDESKTGTIQYFGRNYFFGFNYSL
ncbi:TonB-dependent receptor [Catenovulum agarivorans]|uniref:TonB-dependent receptor n=1 Tax=Catenovulum agarivorans TaxID=1172192 RepID=UPI00030BFB90|nr:TonB-dependent receptor [Catenovulum agarivorans]